MVKTNWGKCYYCNREPIGEILGFPYCKQHKKRLYAALDDAR